MFEEYAPASGTGSANVRWFHELADDSLVGSSTTDGSALGWFPAGAGYPARAMVIPGQRRPGEY